MNAWWKRLRERERWIVSSGLGLALALLLYGLVWQPLRTQLKNLRQGVAEQRAELARMRTIAEEVKRLSAFANTSEEAAQADSGQSLLLLVDRKAKTAGLNETIKRVEPQGVNQLRIQLEQVNFDQMIRWLDSLAQEHGIAVDNANIDRQTSSGRVDARLILRSSE
jgi:general secretion pathway protein M